MLVSLGSVVANEIKLVKFIERKHSIMTENKDLKYIQQLKNQPYISETRTEYVLNQEQPSRTK